MLCSKNQISKKGVWAYNPTHSLFNKQGKKLDFSTENQTIISTISRQIQKVEVFLNILKLLMRLLIKNKKDKYDGKQ
jgi:hypothetical protein